MADAIFEPTPNPTYSPHEPLKDPGGSSEPASLALRITPIAATRIEGHEPALRALLSQLENAVQLAGFSVTDALLLAEVLHDEPSNDVILVLTVAGFERGDDRLDLWEKLCDLVSENDDALISRRFGLAVHSATP
jgi:hypothetical protein